MENRKQKKLAPSSQKSFKTCMKYFKTFALIFIIYTIAIVLNYFYTTQNIETDIIRNVVFATKLTDNMILLIILVVLAFILSQKKGAK